MLDLEKLNELVKLTVDRVIRDYPEKDKIYIDISAIVTEVVKQHSRILKEINGLHGEEGINC